MNRVELRQWFLRLVQRAIRPAQEVEIDTAELDQLVFEACCKMAVAARPVQLRAESTITLNGSTLYAMPTDLLCFFDLEPITIGGTQLFKRTKGELDTTKTGWRDDPSVDSASLSTTGFYYEGGTPTSGALADQRTVGIWPVAASGTAIVPYVRKPRLLSALTNDQSDFSDFPLEFQRVPLYEAAANWGEDIGGIPVGTLDRWRAKYEDGGKRYTRQYGEKQQNDYRPTVAVANVWMSGC